MMRALLRNLLLGAAALAMPFCAWPADAPPSCEGAGAGMQDFSLAASRVAASLATIVVTRPARILGREETAIDFFQPMAGLPLPDPERAAERTFASGFVYDASGYVLTSAHAVRGAIETWVLLPGGLRLPAEVAGLDGRTDIALLRVEASGLIPVRAAPGDVCAGLPVAALGAPFGFERSVSAGVVSAFPRVLPGISPLALVQTDVPLNPGSSGGPLFNAKGEVVAMNAMIYSDRGVFMGVSFAVPIGAVMDVAAELRRSGAVRRSDIGVRLQPVDSQLARAFGMGAPRGALVTLVQPGEAADAAGLRGGDVVLAIGGRAVRDVTQAEQAFGAARAGQPVEVEVWRRRGTFRIVLTPAPSPAAAQVRAARARMPEDRLGLVFIQLKDGAPPGAWVETVTGSALLAGIEAGDRIAAVNGTPVATTSAFDAAVAATGDAPVVALLVWRGTSALYLAVRRLGTGG